MVMFLIESMNEAAMALPTYVAAPDAGGGGGGVFGWINSLASDAQTSFENLAKAAIFLGLLVGLVIARGRLAASVTTVAVAALLWWAVGNFNQGPVSDKIGEEFAAPALVVNEVPDGGTSSA